MHQRANHNRKRQRRLFPLRVAVVRPSSHRAALLFGTAVFPCVIGRSGCAVIKREGDGATPCGRWPLRRLLFRADRVRRPAASLPTRAIRESDGWCDDPTSRRYNQLIGRPFAGRHEALWREDDLYDRIVVIGYNDTPAIPGRGSAIFLHRARIGHPPTEGCVALADLDLSRVISRFPRRISIAIGNQLSPRQSAR